MMRHFFTKFFSTALVLVLVVSLVAFANSCKTKTAATDKIGVVVTLMPQTGFVENIGGERVDVTVMVPPGASPHTYEPMPNQMTAVSKAKMYAKVGSGVEFEMVWMDKLIALNKEMVVVDCSSGVHLQEMIGEHTDEGKEHLEENHHGAMDPHIWLSPLNAKTMVQNICDGLVQVDPDNKAYYEQNRDVYLQKLTELDQDIRDGLSKVTNRRFMVYHPAFGYFAKEYNLIMIPIEEEGKEPTAAGIVHLIEQAKEYNIKVIFASPQFNPESAKVIAEAIDGRVIFINPLARDYVVNLRTVLGTLVQVME